MSLTSASSRGRRLPGRVRFVFLRHGEVRSWRGWLLFEHVVKRGRGYGRETVPDGGRVDGHVGGVHDDRGVGLPGECRRDRACQHRHRAQHERETDPKTIMGNWSVLTTEVASVVTPIRLLMRSAAATDPDIAALLKASDDERLDRMRHHARFLSERGYLREGVTLAEATDVLWTCSSVEIYDLLVLHRGWSQLRSR